MTSLARAVRRTLLAVPLLVVALVAVASIPRAVAAQVLTPVRFGGSAAVGFGSVGVSMHGATWGSKGKKVVVVRVVTMDEWEGGSASPSEKWSDVALLYGLKDQKPNGWLRAALGPSFTFGTRRSEQPITCAVGGLCSYEPIDFDMVGLALEVDAVFGVLRHLGLGLNVFANVNGTAPFGGAGFGLYIGGMQPR
jgi:hypothetical protein